MASIELVVSAFLLVSFVAALISTRLKIPYTLILVSIGVSITVVAILLSLQSSFLQAPMQNLIGPD